MASAHVHCDGHASAPSDTSCIRLDGHRPCTEHLGPLHRTSGQASAPLESVEESAPLPSLSGQASALSSSGMSAFSKPQLTRHNHVAQRLCTWGTWYKPSVLASPAEWRRYPSDTSGGRPLTEAMISYPERASARRWRCTSYHLRQGNGVGTTTVCGAYSQPGHLYHLAGMIWRRRCNAGDTAYADRAALWKEDGAARCHSDSRIIAHHGTTQGE
jgi:hypothetical protein